MLDKSIVPPFDFSPILTKEYLDIHSSILASLSQLQIAECSKDIFNFSKTGTIASQSILRYAHAWYNKVSASSVSLYAFIEMLQIEINRRFVNLIVKTYKPTQDEFENVLTVGTEVWYVDEDSEFPEHGYIHSVYYKKGVLDVFSVDFPDAEGLDGFDEFLPSTLHNSIFLTYAKANEHIIALQTNKNKEK